MSQVRGQTLVSLKSAATLSAYRVVRVSAANTVNYHDTTTSLIFGVTTQAAVQTNGAVSICIGGSAKVGCAASVSAGSLVTAQSATASGLIMEVGASEALTSTTVIPKVLGIALQSGSTNSVIEVALQIVNTSKAVWA